MPAPTHAHGHKMSAEMRQCLDNCLNCYRTCVETLEHCVTMGGEHADPDHLRLMADCKDICLTSANFLMRQSALHVFTCSACAEVCQRCGDDCARLAADDPGMKACADACHKCAESCRKMFAGHKASASRATN